MSRAPRRDEPQATPTELAANESRPTQPGQVANGTTTVRWDLSRPPARPLDATHHNASKGIQFDAQPRFAPTRVQPCRVWLAPTAGTDGLKAILRTRTPSTMSRAPRRDELRVTPAKLRRHRTPLDRSPPLTSRRSAVRCRRTVFPNESCARLIRQSAIHRRIDCESGTSLPPRARPARPS
jgi:hypothetical protein